MTSFSAPLLDAPWKVGPCLAIELDMVLTFLINRTPPLDNLPRSLADWIVHFPQEQLKDLEDMLQPALTQGKPFNFLEWGAFLAGEEFNDNYSQVTLAIRQLSPASAKENLLQIAATAGIELDPLHDLLELSCELGLAIPRQINLPIMPENIHSIIQRNIFYLNQVMEGGTLHARFWHWLDRFYYQFYQPWRETQADYMAGQEKRALLALRSSEKINLDWLSPQNMLTHVTEVKQAVLDGRWKVYFWVEPFGLADVSSLLPGGVLVSFAIPGEFYESFFHFTEDLSNRLKALADPNRLIILRLIRNYAMVNTDIARFMGLARPTVSIHAKILREAGLIHSFEDGRMVRHEIQVDELRRLFQDLERLLDLPDASILPILQKAVAEDEKPTPVDLTDKT